MTNYFLPSQNVTVNLMTRSLACEQEHKRVRRSEIGVANNRAKSSGDDKVTFFVLLPPGRFAADGSRA